jgi:hypothetical protein
LKANSKPFKRIKSQPILFWYLYLQALLQTRYNCFLIEVRQIENLNCEGYNRELLGYGMLKTPSLSMCKLGIELMFFWTLFSL